MKHEKSTNVQLENPSATGEGGPTQSTCALTVLGDGKGLGDKAMQALATLQDVAHRTQLRRLHVILISRQIFWHKDAMQA